jgi:uncharacterized lipoprotein YajG
MNRTSSIVLIIGVSLALLAACSKRDKIVNGVGDDDPEMVAAIAKAPHASVFLADFREARPRRDQLFAED